MCYPGGRGSMSSLGGESGQLYRPGLSAGISGAGYAEDGRSVASSVQSSVAAVSQANCAEAREESARYAQLSTTPQILKLC